jgi:acetylglutamate kinase
MNHLVIVKLGGTTVASQAAVLAEVAGLSRVRPMVVVHGGGVQVTEWLTRLGLPTRFEDGLRVTDEASIEVVAAVLRGAINTALVAALRARGADAVGLSGVDGGLLVAERSPGKGLVATVVDVRRALLDALLLEGRVAVVAPLALDETGTVCNVNADDAAAGLARGLGAERLVLLTDTDGVLGADGTRIGRLQGADAESLVADGTISSGMVPKVRFAISAITGVGAGSVVIADGAAPHALERALAEGDFGTRIVPDADDKAGAANAGRASSAGHVPSARAGAVREPR